MKVLVVTDECLLVFVCFFVNLDIFLYMREML